MTLSSPYVASAPTPRPSASIPSFPLAGSDAAQTIFPFRISVASGALSAQLTSERLYVTDQGSNVYRVYHPNCRPGDIIFYVTSISTASIAVDTSTAADGYSQITVGAAATADFSGFISIRRGREIVPSFANAIATPLGGNLRSRSKFPVNGGVPDLSCWFLRFSVDTEGAVVTGSVKGAPAPVFVSRTGEGEYTVAPPVLMSENWVLLPSVPGDTSGAVLEDGNVVITAGGGADPASVEVSLLCIGPTSMAGIRSMAAVNSGIHPKSAQGYPMKSYVRSGVLSVFKIAIDANEDITLANTITPGGVSFSSDGSDLLVDNGKAVEGLTVSQLRQSAASSGHVGCDYSEVEGDGTLLYGMPAGPDTLVGFFLSGTAESR